MLEKISEAQFLAPGADPVTGDIILIPLNATAESVTTAAAYDTVSDPVGTLGSSGDGSGAGSPEATTAAPTPFVTLRLDGGGASGAENPEAAASAPSPLLTLGAGALAGSSGAAVGTTPSLETLGGGAGAGNNLEAAAAGAPSPLDTPGGIGACDGNAEAAAVVPSTPFKTLHAGSQAGVLRSGAAPSPLYWNPNMVPGEYPEAAVIQRTRTVPLPEAGTFWEETRPAGSRLGRISSRVSSFLR